MSSHKGIPLTKQEVMQLINLVETNPVVYNKATNAKSNQLKEAAWATITDSFNSIIESNPRKPEQLRLKWENLKKTARKRSTRIRMNNLKTDGRKPDYIPPDDALDRVASILGPNCDDYSVQFGGDAVDLLSMHTPKPKFIFSSMAKKGNLKPQTIADEVKVSIRDRNRAIADYYNSKRKWEEEINILKKRKLELEIKEHEKNLTNS